MSSELKDSIRISLEWIGENRQELATGLVLQGFFPAPSDLKGFHPSHLPVELQAQLDVNSADWLLFESRVEENGKYIPMIEIVTEEEGPALNPEQKRWLRGLEEEGLRIYQLQRSEPEHRIAWFRDILAPGTSLLPVRDPVLAEGIEKGSFLGARLIGVDGALETTGALYIFSPEEVESLLFEFADTVREKKLEEGGESYRRTLARLIIRHWILSLIPPEIREQKENGEKSQIDDVPPGESPILIVDHFQITNQEKLMETMKFSPLFSGNPQVGFQFLVDGEPTGSVVLRDRGILDLASADGITADANRAALEKEMGESLRFLSRESFAGEGTGSPAQGGIPDSAEGRTGMIRDMVESKFGDWSDRPHADLNGETPREAMKTEEGEIRVRELIDSYEREEEARAARNNRPPVKFDFLRKQVGLE